MNIEDKRAHYDNVIKSLTEKCYSRCTPIESNKECLSTCYHKYVLSIAKIHSLIASEGSKTRSEIVNKVYLPFEKPIDDVIYPLGGRPLINNHFKFAYSDVKLYQKYGKNPFVDDSINR